MVKFDSEKETIAINGTVKDLVYDTVLMVRVIYESLKEHGHKEAAEHYKSMALECIPDAFLDEEDVKKKSEERYNEAGKMLEEMQEMLDTLREMHSGLDPNPECKENFQDEFNKWLYGQESEDE